jgi:hypothetical protein
VEVEPAAEAPNLLRDLMRAKDLIWHEAWLLLRAEYCFVHEFVDKANSPRAHCCVLEELADRNLEQDIIDRAVQQRGYDGLFALWAALLHGLQAFHAQGCLHRDICARNIFFKGEDVKLGSPGPVHVPATAEYYPSGECSAYSADMFALGLVFFEMTMLHQVSDVAAGGPDEVLRELSRLGGGTEAVRAWLAECCSLLGKDVPGEAVVDVLGALLAVEPWARPTADDLLEWPAFAAHVDPLRVLPASARPCVVMAHNPGIAKPFDVPRRSVVSVPGFHCIFSQEGAAVARRECQYNWCGKSYKLWWLSTAEAPQHDRTEARALVDQTPPPLPAGAGAERTLPPLSAKAAYALAARDGPSVARSLEATAAALLSADAPGPRPVAAEVLYRASLRTSAVSGGTPGTWIALAGTLLQRGELMAAKQYFELGQRLALAQQGGADAPTALAPLYGRCEFFVGINILDMHWRGASLNRSAAVSREASNKPTVPSAPATQREKPGPRRTGVPAPGCGGRERGSGGRERGEAAAGSPRDVAGALRSAHVELYYRSVIALESASWESLIGLSEFYRLVGCPEQSMRSPVPDLETAQNYFRQAQGLAPASALGGAL